MTNYQVSILCDFLLLIQDFAFSSSANTLISSVSSSMPTTVKTLSTKQSFANFLTPSSAMMARTKPKQTLEAMSGKQLASRTQTRGLTSEQVVFCLLCVSCSFRSFIGQSWIECARHLTTEGIFLSQFRRSI